MSPSPALTGVVGLSAVAAAVAVAPSAVARPPVDADAGAQHCTTRLLTLAELRAGVRSEVTCADTFAAAMGSVGVVVPAGRPVADQEAVALASGSVLAVHHDQAAGAGSTLSITGTSCSGGGISFGAGDGWNDRIRSTTHRLCTQVKHWTGPEYAGSSQLTEGGDGAVRNLNGALAGAVSSIRYW